MGRCPSCLEPEPTTGHACTPIALAPRATAGFEFCIEGHELRAEWDGDYAELRILTCLICGHTSVRDIDQLTASGWMHACPGPCGGIRVVPLKARAA